MSAITGIYHLNGETVPIEHCTKLMSGFQHFPADDIKIWFKENVFLGCHAQWITPESVGEILPYYDHEKRLSITADAIIDNRDELFNCLHIGQAASKMISDSELIILAYQKWGEDAPKYLIGDFAFIIWDEKKQLLFGARDFSGNRTLYFHRSQQHFAFCSAIQPLLTLPYVGKQLNEQWLAEFIAIPDMFDTTDSLSTVYKDIEQLPPSHTFSVTNGRVLLSRYCTITPGELIRFKSDQEYVEAFREVFQNSVNARLRTHRCVGSHLSGGLDSGSVVGFAAKALKKENKTLHTFSYIPPKDFIDWTPKWRMADERPFIHEIVQYLGNINVHYLDFEGINPLSEVDDWLNTLEMPYKFFENSFWLKGIYEEAQRQGIGVLLNGARGNFTISWGSALEYYAVLLKKLNWVRLCQEINLYSKNTGAKKARIMSVVAKKSLPFPTRKSSSDNRYRLPVFINPQLANRTNVFEKLRENGLNIMGSPAVDVYKERIEHFQKLFTWNTTGTWAAKLSMRYSLWHRDPTNDIRVIRFCLSLPEDQYVKNGLDRALVRRSTENYLPDKVRLNYRVRGVQGADWVHRMAPVWNNFTDELDRLSTDPIASEFFDLQVIKTALSKVREKPRPECAFDPDFRILMRSLIVYRFIKNYA